MNGFDLVIVGGGPAGLAAAVAASELKLSVALVDEQPEPGGQIYRAVERANAQGRAAKLGPDYLRGLELVRAFRASGVRHLPSHQVWQIEAEGRVFATNGTTTTVLHGRRLLVAVGALERPVPMPGWTLPGVMTVGSAQIVHKTTGALPDEGVWIAGSGPLVLHYAAEVAAAGGRLAGLLDTTAASPTRAAFANLAGVMRGWRYVAQGMGYLSAIRRAGIRHIRRVEAVEAIGTERVERVRWRVGGRWAEAATSGLLVHEGVVPSTHTTYALGCRHDWDPVQHCFRPRTDAFGQTTVPAVFVAGDCAGIGGARVAEGRGRLAALGIAAALEMITAEQRDRLARPVVDSLASHASIRPFLDALYRPAARLLAPADDVVICRCEGVTAGEVRAAATLGCGGPNQVKSFTRCGMGPCQGRMCGSTVTTVLADSLHAAPQEVGAFRIRPPLKPISLAELAALAGEKDAA